MTIDSDTSETSDMLFMREKLRRYLDDARKLYEQIVNRLWAGNAAGVFAVIGAIGGGKAHGFAIRAALCAFLLGLLILAVGTFLSLILQARIVRDLEKAESLLDLRIESIQSSSEEIGLTISDTRTIMGLLSAMMFFVGTGCGLYFSFLVF